MNLDVWKIKLILAEKGLSQSDLAKKTGVTRQQISQIFARRNCSLRTAGKLAKGLGVPISDIVEEG